MMLSTCEKDIFFCTEDGKMYVAIRNGDNLEIKYVLLAEYLEKKK